MSVVYHDPTEAIRVAYHLIAYYSDTWKGTTWFGIPTWQNPNDVWMHQEIIWEVKPDLVIETGTLYGGSAALWATLLQHANPDGRVLSIGLRPDTEEASALPIVQAKVDFLSGSSTDPEIVAEVRARASGKRVLVILDSNHGCGHVLAELAAYSPLVGVGSYVIVQDTNVNGHPIDPNHGPGPFEAVEEFLSESDRFVRDLTRERLLYTMHPGGYLRCVK